MGSGYWLKNVISLRKAKDGRSKRLKGTSIGRKGDERSRKEPSRITSSASIKNQRELGMPLEDKVAIRIQTAFRAYVARKTLRRLKGIARLQSLTQGPSVKKQASSTLSYIHSWSRIQGEIRTRRVRMVIEGHIKQKKLENQSKLEAKLHTLELCEAKSTKWQREAKSFANSQVRLNNYSRTMKRRPLQKVEWSGGPETMEVVLARIHQREEAAVKRERAMAYAFSHQWRANSNPMFGSNNHDIGKSNWGWSWTDRWIAARPWESRTPVQLSPKMANRITSKTPKSNKPQSTKTPASVKSISANWRGTLKPRKLSYEPADKLTAQKGIDKVEVSIDKQKVVS